MKIKPDYQSLWDTMEIIEKVNLEYACQRIKVFESVYCDAEVKTGVPWEVLACMHYKEASLDFTKHLHNGDPMSDSDGRWLRTVKRPIKRPVLPPKNGSHYTWQESAIDAINHHLKGYSIDIFNFTWDIPNTLWFMEAWNGFGFLNKGVHTPYLWAGTNHYKEGLFIEKRDPAGSYVSVFEPKKVAHTVGAAAILKRFNYQPKGEPSVKRTSETNSDGTNETGNRNDSMVCEANAEQTGIL